MSTVPTEREIEAAGRRLDAATAGGVIHQQQCRTRLRGADCLACTEHDEDEFAAQSRYDALVLLKAGARMALVPA